MYTDGANDNTKVVPLVGEEVESILPPVDRAYPWYEFRWLMRCQSSALFACRSNILYLTVISSFTPDEQVWHKHQNIE